MKKTSQLKEKMLEKLMDSMEKQFSPEALLDAMLEKPIVQYVEVAVFKTDTGKICLTVNKLPKPIDITSKTVFEVQRLTEGAKVIVIPCEKPKSSSNVQSAEPKSTSK